MNFDDKKDKKEPVIRETPMTYSDYAALDDGNRYELADGKLELMSPGPSMVHQLFSFELHKRLAQSCETQYFVLFAPIDVILSPTEVRQPDILMIHRNRIDILSKRGVEGAPDLVVEIISPSTIKRDRLNKWHVYAKYGIPEYWVVEPLHGTLEQFVLQDGSYQLAQIYSGDDRINSEHLACISFTMGEIISVIPDLRD